MQKYIEKSLLNTIIFVFVANTMALFFHWYRLIWWFDMPMHFLGGFFSAWLVLYICIRFLHIGNDRILSQKVLNQVVLYAFVIGFGWEAFEWGTDIYTGAQDMHLVDSFSDLFFDLAGIFSAIFMFKNSHKSAHLPKE